MIVQLATRGCALRVAALGGDFSIRVQLSGNKEHTRKHRYQHVTHAGCRVPSADSRVPSAERRVPSADCRVPSAECRVPSAQCPRVNEKLRGSPHHFCTITLLRAGVAIYLKLRGGKMTEMGDDDMYEMDDSYTDAMDVYHHQHHQHHHHQHHHPQPFPAASFVLR